MCVENWFSWFPPLPLARELKVGLTLEKHAQACGLRRSPGLAAVPFLYGRGLVRSLPVTLPGHLSAHDTLGRIACNERNATVASAVPCSALQSRGGDGLIRVGPGVGQVTHRLPVHEVRGDCGGPVARCW